MRLIFYFISVLIFFCSCTPLRKVKYLQTSNEEDTQILLEYEADFNPYNLKPGDLISIIITTLTPNEYNFFQRENMRLSDNFQNETEFRVDNEGWVKLPVIGKVYLQGKSIEEAQFKIFQELIKYMEDPLVKIKLINSQITVLGEVNRPGTYPISKSRINIFQAIGLAGDITAFGDRNQIKIVRQTNRSKEMTVASSLAQTTNVGYGITKKNMIEVNEINVLDESILTSKYFYLQPNDVLIVSPLKSKNVKNNAVNISLILSAITAISLILSR
ncbi:polysaccharide biosynthesis/export family protein [Xanthovirga aplysinae]|uniref:polysaccharide biosynthesis/export family protein n=1 Tax=Xanthovirga aplysinae TaxID=2529853 RepID=UPI0012BCCFDA|nr:polysaccharide biosynthesis/export family protein [Xanthovirga aplysinae]MTI30918.1 hypothetical protein [Xanthovirga aplysinae]